MFDCFSIRKILKIRFPLCFHENYSVYDNCEETSWRHRTFLCIRLLCIYLYWTIWKLYFRGQNREEEKGEDHGENYPIKGITVFQDQLFICHICLYVIPSTLTEKMPSVTRPSTFPIPIAIHRLRSLCFMIHSPKLPAMTVRSLVLFYCGEVMTKAAGGIPHLV